MNANEASAVAYTLDKTAKELVCHMFFDGPVWDGNLISKRARSELVALGLVDQAMGYNFLSVAGVMVACAMGFYERKTGRHPRASDEWIDYCSRKDLNV